MATTSSSDEAEDIAHQRFLQDDRRGYLGINVRECKVCAAEVPAEPERKSGLPLPSISDLLREGQ